MPRTEKNVKRIRQFKKANTADLRKKVGATIFAERKGVCVVSLSSVGLARDDGHR